MSGKLIWNKFDLKSKGIGQKKVFLSTGISYARAYGVVAFL